MAEKTFSAVYFQKSFQFPVSRWIRSKKQKGLNNLEDVTVSVPTFPIYWVLELSPVTADGTHGQWTPWPIWTAWTLSRTHGHRAAGTRVQWAVSLSSNNSKTAADTEDNIYYLIPKAHKTILLKGPNYMAICTLYNNLSETIKHETTTN